MVVRMLPLPLQYILLGILILCGPEIMAQGNPQRATMTPFVDLYQQQSSAAGQGSGRPTQDRAPAPVVYTPPARTRKPKRKNEKSTRVTTAKPLNVRHQ